MVGLTRLMSTIYPGFVFRVFHLLLGRLPSKADEFYLPKAKSHWFEGATYSPFACSMSAKTVLATSRPYIRLVCQEATCCACRMEHFMEVQELIFAVHPGMTDHLRTNIPYNMYIFLLHILCFNIFLNLFLLFSFERKFLLSGDLMISALLCI